MSAALSSSPTHTVYKIAICSTRTQSLSSATRSTVMLPAFIPATISSMIITSADRPISTSIGSHSLLITLVYSPGDAPVVRVVRLEKGSVHRSTCSLVMGCTLKKRKRKLRRKRKNKNERTDPEDEIGENARRSEGKKTRVHPNYKLT